MRGMSKEFREFEEQLKKKGVTVHRIDIPLPTKKKKTLMEREIE
jgi:hypothetical protein